MHYVMKSKKCLKAVLNVVPFLANIFVPLVITLTMTQPSANSTVTNVDCVGMPEWYYLHTVFNGNAVTKQICARMRALFGMNEKYYYVHDIGSTEWKISFTATHVIHAYMFNYKAGMSVWNQVQNKNVQYVERYCRLLKCGRELEACRINYPRVGVIICNWQYLFTSRKPTHVLQCGHTIHLECYNELVRYDCFSCVI